MENTMDVVKLYDYLHTIPELGFEEVKTAEFLAQELEKLGYKVTRNIGKTGVIGEIIGTEPGPTVLARADMDALPFVDAQGQHYANHSCGHDAHCSMLLVAAANVVGKIKKGKLRVLFQPGEETLRGALAVIQDGIIDDVDIALGMHVRPIQDIPDGTMSPAVCHASSTFVTIDVEGKGCHGARPHLGVNAVEAAVLIANALMALKLNPALAWSCKVTGIKGGYVAPNIIPDKAQMIIDARAQTNELMDELMTKLTRAAQGAAAALGATAKVTTPGGIIPAAEYNQELTDEVAECIKEVVGADKCMPIIINPGGEDFHYFVRKFPKIKAAYFGVGAGVTPGLHAQDMHLNKNSLHNGAEVMTKMILKIMG